MRARGSAAQQNQRYDGFFGPSARALVGMSADVHLTPCALLRLRLSRAKYVRSARIVMMASASKPAVTPRAGM